MTVLAVAGNVRLPSAAGTCVRVTTRGAKIDRCKARASGDSHRPGGRPTASLQGAQGSPARTSAAPWKPRLEVAQRAPVRAELSYGYRAGPNRFVRTLHEWGDIGYRFTDLDHDGIVELASADDRFAYAFTCYACSAFPVQIWHYQDGAMVDVTAHFPQVVRRDASVQWRRYLGERRRRGGDVREIFAAYLADRYLLGTQAGGWRRVRQVNARGELRPAGGCFSSTPCDGEYLVKLSRFLKRTGYSR